MKNGKRSRMRALAAAGAMTAIAYALRGTPASAEPRDPGPAAAGSIARTALFLPGSAAGARGIAQDAAFKGGSGQFTGKREYAYYGYVKVQAVIQGGRLADVKVLEYPNDNGRSHYINSIALPYLIQEAVGAQSYRVDFISGATFTSSAFMKSLQEALQGAGG